MRIQFAIYRLNRIQKKLVEYNDEPLSTNDKIYQKLTLDFVTDKEFTALTEDKQSRFMFFFSEVDRLAANFGVNSEFYSNRDPSEIPTGLSKPFVYHRISN